MSDRATVGAPGAASSVAGNAGLQPDARAGPELDRLAHELRTPLAAIQSMADALASGHLGGLEARHAGYLASIRETARHALAVLDGMIGSPEAATPSGDRDAAPIDLEAIAAEVVVGMAMLAAGAGVRLDAQKRVHGRIAFGSATDVRRMLINLISNSITHGGGGSTVFVTIGGDGEAEAWIDVTDNGPGLPDGLLAQLSAGGLLDGDAASRPKLGLRLTRHLAALNAGRLELTTGPGGTRARVVLPMAPSSGVVSI